MFKKFKILVIALGLVFFAGASQAALNTVDPGPYTPATGNFPLWYSDAAGTTLDLCLSKTQSSRAPGSYMCTLLPNPGVFDDNLPIVFPFNFPDEAFWFTADAFIEDVPSGVNLEYISAVEAAFGGGLPAPGDQISFARIRIRVDVEVAGTYTITHPFGSETVVVTSPGRRAINMTRDIGIGAAAVFTGALKGDVGPFLHSVNGPYTEINPETGATETFIGDPNILEPVTGSILTDSTGVPQNYVRIVGPNIDLRTDLFAVSGRIWNGSVPTPVTIDRSSYSRTVAGTQISAFATAPPTATVSFRETLMPGAEFPMAGDATGKFFARDQAPSTLPSYLVVTADDAATTPSVVASRLVDVVKISKAVYDKATKILTVEASSSDEVEVPVLTVPGHGTMDATENPQRLIVEALPESPATVTVRSSAGGLDTEPVIVIPVPGPTVTAPAPITITIPCASGVSASHPAVSAFLNGATAIDPNNPAVPLSVGNDAPAIFSPGVIKVVFYAFDSDGNQGVASSTITIEVEANSAPAVTPPAPITITIPLCSAGLPVTDARIVAFLAAATATDAQDGILTVANDAPATFPPGITTVTFTASDVCGLTTTATATVTIDAPVNTVPVLTAPAPVVITAPLCALDLPATDARIAAFLGAASAGDTQDGPLNVTNDAPATFPPGITTVTFTAADVCGLTATATSTITVEIPVNNAPVVTAPAPIAVIIPPGFINIPSSAPDIVAFLNAATATDTEDGTLPVTSDIPATLPVGVTTVTFTATDSCGLVSTVTSTINATPSVDLKIVRFQAPNRILLGDRVSLTLVLTNVGTVNGQVPATVVGVQGGLTVFSQTLQVSDQIGGSNTTFIFGPFTPTTGGPIDWTVTVQDANPDTATATTIVPSVDLSIASFVVTNPARLRRTVDAIALVRNIGTVNGPARATLVGVQNGVTVYNRSMQVNNPVGSRVRRFNFPRYRPTSRGVINWTLTLHDTNPDTATAVTNVR